MVGKIATTLAISIDGYIADEDGGYAWITGQGDDSQDTERGHSFEEFIRDIDLVVMGHECYRQGFAADFKDKEVYVASSIPQQDQEHIHFISGDIVSIIEQERERGKQIFLFGGGILLDVFIKADVIEEYIIGIVPIILGKGRPLFLGNNPTLPLHLENYAIRDGIFDIRYTRRR